MAATPSKDAFDAYFHQADLDRDGRISGAEAVAFFQGSNLPKQVLAQIWVHADQRRIGFLGRQEFYNALKLATVAQSGRELTPDIVKAALFGSATAKIPAPKISPMSSPVQMNMGGVPANLNSMVRPATTGNTGVPTASQNLGFSGAQTPLNPSMNQQFFPSPDSQVMRPQSTHSTGILTQGTLSGLPVRSSMPGPQSPNSNFPNPSTDWLGGRNSGAPVGNPPQIPAEGITPVKQDEFGLSSSGKAMGMPPNFPTPGAPSTSIAPKLPDSVLFMSSVAQHANPLVSSGNGLSSDSTFERGIFSATQTKADTSVSSANVSSSAVLPVASGSQNSIKPGKIDPFSTLANPSSVGVESKEMQSSVKQNLLGVVPNTSNASVASVTSVSTQQPELPWPKFTQSNIQKYTNVFMAVNKDKDGKITGEQARNLFLSWRLPREVLKQVWDLSDQDNDSMLTLREFCTALYLMERHREGRSLPDVLPNSIKFDEALLQATGQPLTAYGGPIWQQNPGMLQPGIVPASFPVMAPPSMRPPLPNPVHSRAGSVLQPLRRSPVAPVMEKHLVNRYNNEEQGARNLKSHVEADAQKKVLEAEKEILDSKEKIEFYRTKMQELVLYKSRCDNRLNEITERASADKREAESLAKKYEEKYKQVGELASRLTVEDASFRDIQERKLELQKAMTKMEQGGSTDGLLQVRADRVQSDLEELVKALNERRKLLGLHVKQAVSVELPFGWQPGIQEGAVDWDEDWDKFEDEGFTVAKDLTVEAEHADAIGTVKSPSVWSDKTSVEDTSPVASSYTEKVFNTSDRINQNGLTYAQSDGSPSGSPARSISESQPQEFSSPHFDTHDLSPRIKGSFSDHGGADSVSGDKYTYHPYGQAFDANDDADSVWGFNTMRDTDHDRSSQNSFFGSGDLALNHVKVDSPRDGSLFGKDRRSPFFDSIPSTPALSSNSPRDRKSLFFDSIPSTPAHSSNSPRFNMDGIEGHSFDNYSRFDSFGMNDSGLFSQSDSLARFDSIRSSRDSEHHRGFSFDDTDPFAATGPFKSSESHNSPKRNNSWNAF